MTLWFCEFSIFTKITFHVMCAFLVKHFFHTKYSSRAVGRYIKLKHIVARFYDWESVTFCLSVTFTFFFLLLLDRLSRCLPIFIQWKSAIDTCWTLRHEQTVNEEKWCESVNTDVEWVFCTCGGHNEVLQQIESVIKNPLMDYLIRISSILLLKTYSKLLWNFDFLEYFLLRPARQYQT